MVEITNIASIELPSTSMKSGAVGSVKWISKRAQADSAKAIVAWGLLVLIDVQICDIH